MCVDQAHSTLHQGCSMERDARMAPWRSLLLAAHAFGGTWLCSIYVMRHGGCTLKQANRAGWKGRKERLKNVLSHTPLPTCHSSNFGQMKIWPIGVFPVVRDAWLLCCDVVIPSFWSSSRTPNLPARAQMEPQCHHPKSS